MMVYLLLPALLFTAEATSAMMRMENKIHPEAKPSADGIHTFAVGGPGSIPHMSNQPELHPRPQQIVTGQSLEQPRAQAATHQGASSKVHSGLPAPGDIIVTSMPVPGSCSEVKAEGGTDTDCIKMLGTWVETLRNHYWPAKDNWIDVDSNTCHDGGQTNPLQSCELAYHDSTTNLADGVCVKVKGREAECWALLNHEHAPKDYFACQESFADHPDIAGMCSLPHLKPTAEVSSSSPRRRREPRSSRSSGVAATTTAIPEQDEFPFYGYDPKYVASGFLFIIFVMFVGGVMYIYSMNSKHGHGHYGQGHGYPGMHGHPHGPPPGYGHGPPSMHGHGPSHGYPQQQPGAAAAEAPSGQ